ncbi:NCS1 family nucleobase:cation symporter-1 [bacterium]|nr:NCS1 family nucleobase:cation symporter-1 [bacterium]
MKVQREAGTLVELTTETIESLKESPLFNEDLKPVPISQRTWNVRHFASLWIGMAVCVPTYTLASGLINSGMNWWQAIMTVFLGNAIVLIPMAMIAFAGTKYGIPYPIFCRASFGSRGAHLPALLRAGVACGWFGIQCWIGGQFLNVALTQSFDFWNDLDKQWVYVFDPNKETDRAIAEVSTAYKALLKSKNAVKNLKQEIAKLQAAKGDDLAKKEAELETAINDSMTFQAKFSESKRYVISLGMVFSFLIFWIINVWIGYKGAESIKWMETWGAPILIGIGGILILWAFYVAGGIWELFKATDRPNEFLGGITFVRIFLPSLNGMISFWATLALNIPDFSRYAKSQRDQVLGQVIGLPATMGFYAFVGVCGTLGSIVVFGQAIWDPSELLARFNSPILSIIGGFAIFLATITTNIAANVVAPANAFSNLAPRIISYRIGAIITGIIGFLIQPWKLLSEPSGYIFGWLGTYGSFLGPLAGLYLADYYFIHRQRLNLKDLYIPNTGKYNFRYGINWIAFIAYFLSVIPFILTLKFDLGISGRNIQENSWTIGLVLSFAFYAALMKLNRSSITSKSEYQEITENG